MSTQRNPYSIALDTMGGDFGPLNAVPGGVLAAREHGVRVLLVGDPDTLAEELTKVDTTGLSVEVVASEGVIEEGESTLRALQAKPKASVAVAAGLVKSGQADAMVSMGSTGAAMAASVLALGMFPGLDRPALGGPFIALAPKTTIMDLGAQVDCRPAQLLSFGALGTTFSRVFLQMPKPRVALLSVGAEKGKGNRQVQEAYALFEDSGLNFIGNIEGQDIFSQKAEVVVCDGFVGNILLKFTEGLAHAAAQFLGQALGEEAQPVRQLQELASSAESAGGPLFGVNGVVLIGHGRSGVEAFAKSIGRAKQVLDLEMVEAMRQDLAAVMQTTVAPGTNR